MPDGCIDDPGSTRNTAAVLNQDYRLTVEGELSDQVSSGFAGMTLTRNGGRTTLEGRVRDQAELQALLQRVSDFGLTLISATVIDRS